MDAENGRVPDSLSDVQLTSFQAMLLIQTLQPSALYLAMNQFAEKALGSVHFFYSLLLLFFLSNSLGVSSLRNVFMKILVRGRLLGDFNTWLNTMPPA